MHSCNFEGNHNCQASKIHYDITRIIFTMSFIEDDRRQSDKSANLFDIIRLECSKLKTSMIKLHRSLYVLWEM